jgi:gas vesicle protein
MRSQPQVDKDSLDVPEDESNASARRDDRSSSSGTAALSLLLGFGIGIGLAILFAPQSGEETRKWIGATAEDQMWRFRRRGRRLVFEAQDLLDRGEQGVNRALRTGKNVLDSVASKLD